MAEEHVYIIDDIYRPDDGNGHPVDVATNELLMSGLNHQFHWYTSCSIVFTPDTANLNSRFDIIDHVIDLSSSTIMNLQFVVEVSTDANFQTILYTRSFKHSTGSTDMATEIYTYSIERPNSSLTRVLHQPGGLRGYRSDYGTRILIDTGLSGSGMKFWVRIKEQIRANGSSAYVDCQRQTGGVWKTFEMYAPFYQNITPPAHFYANGINTFDTVIPSQYKFEYSDGKFNDKNIGSNNYRIVRTVSPPYITEGETTNHLYWCPMRKVSDTNHVSSYQFTSTLKVADATDPNYYIVVAKRTVSGTVEYKETDDLSMIGNISWALSDPTGMYEQYNTFLKNVANTINVTLLIDARYGALIRATYRNPEGSNPGNRGFVLDEAAAITTGSASFAISNITNYSGQSVYVGAWVFSGNYTLLSDTYLVPILTYTVPSLPVASIHRCDSDGTANDNGDHCRIDWAVAITPINNQNSKKLTIRHPEGTTEFDPLDSYTQSGSLIVAASTESTYEIDFTVADDLNTITKSLRLSTAQAVLDLLYGGGGIAFGKVANVQDAVEISDLWKLICYKLMLNGIDMNKWVKQLESRVGALEQYVGHGASTTQYQVSFFNGNELLDRQWITTNYIADPIDAHRIDTPTKETTETTVYSFAGWAIGSSATVVDPDALTNITAHRDIYAIFGSATRFYQVAFYNESTKLSETSVQYHGYGRLPTNPTKTGFVFAGYSPAHRYVNRSVNAQAQFYDDSEITDDWATIMEACEDGTAITKYKLGQYKELNCGTYGKIYMRIKAFKLNTYYRSERKILISWEGKDCLPTKRRMNPTLVDTETGSRYTNGTGCVGGWESSELRQWCNNDLYNAIDPDVRNHIKISGRVSRTVLMDSSQELKYRIDSERETEDKISIPSYSETKGYASSGETSGATFWYEDSSQFPRKTAHGSSTRIPYWYRTCAITSNKPSGFYCFNSYDNSSMTYFEASTDQGVCICFCT